jgi:cellobiose-specific phosphotransferase system component IIB
MDMLRIAISCGEGFSSGFLAGYLKKEIVQAHLEDQVSVERIPFFELIDRQEEVDLAMILPHIEWKIKDVQVEWKIPLYVIPYKPIIKPTIYDFLEDAEDILKYADGRTGRIYFPGEQRTASITRTVSYRKWTAEKEKKA